MNEINWVWVIIYYVTLSFYNVNSKNNTIRILLTGDVMLGRGIDQILKYPIRDLRIPRQYKTNRNQKINILHYIDAAEKRNGKFPSHKITSQSDYIWGDMLNSMQYYTPDIKILNIENSITTSNNPLPAKSIRFRMNPKNIYILNRINNNRNLICTVSNNHVFDWGYKGLKETWQTFINNNISYSGIGKNINDAWNPSVIELPNKNCIIFVFGIGSVSAGIHKGMDATTNRSGLALVNVSDISNRNIAYIMKMIEKYVLNYTKGKMYKKNIIILSLHWGPNWDWNVKHNFKQFAHALIDYNNGNNIQIDLIHGHSSHHIKGIEIYKNKAIFYGVGDLLFDNEGSHINDEWNSDLGFMYFVDLNVYTGNIYDIILKGTQVKQFRIKHAQNESLMWLHNKMKMLCEELNVTLELNEYDQTLRLKNSNKNVEKIINNISMRKYVSFNLSYFCWILFVVLVVLNVPLRRLVIQKKKSNE